MEKLQVKQVQYGAYTLDVAVDADLNITMSQATLARLLGYAQKRLSEKLDSKKLKDSLGMDSACPKFRGKVDNKKALVSLVPLDFAIAVIGWSAIKEQNPRAEAIMLSAFSTDIKGTILKEFGHEISIDALRLQEQFRWLRVFQFREWTDVIRDRHVECFGCKPTNEYYRDLITMVNLALFDVHNFKSDRDNMDGDQQELIRDFEKMLVRQSKKHPDLDPKELVVHTLPMF